MARDLANFRRDGLALRVVSSPPPIARLLNPDPEVDFYPAFLTRVF
jgi:hypothetical protein